jgi:hypothetical protein
MSDEQRNEDEDEIEVESHGNRAGVQEEPSEEAEADEFEAHIKVPNVRMD